MPSDMIFPSALKFIVMVQWHTDDELKFALARISLVMATPLI